MKKKKEFLTHISSYRQEYTWVAIFLLFLVMASMHATLFGSVIISCITIVPMMILTWLLRRVLMPRFLHKQSWIYYFHGFIAVTCLTLISSFLEGNVYSYLYHNELMEVSENMENSLQTGGIHVGYVYLHAKSMVLFTITLAVVTVSHLLDERKRIEQETKDMQMQMELKYLRAQVNPHFLFNTLNCIYSLTLTQDEMAPDSVLKLSEMLRYVNDDCRADEVPIKKEIAYINNYIDFQKIRMGHKPDIYVEYRLDDELFGIPPMIFQPMVENCFKHSRIVDDQSAYIKISLIQKNGHVLFVTENSKHHAEYSLKDEKRTGIGVQNVRQRLDLLFGNAYSFDVKEDENSYKTRLKF